MNRFWWALPGPARFLGAVESDLRAGRSTILCMPSHPELEIRDALRDLVLDRVTSCEWEEIDLSKLGELPSAPARLLHLFFDSSADPGDIFDEQSLADC